MEFTLIMSGIICTYYKYMILQACLKHLTVGWAEKGHELASDLEKFSLIFIDMWSFYMLGNDEMHCDDEM